MKKVVVGLLVAILVTCMGCKTPNMVSEHGEAESGANTVTESMAEETTDVAEAAISEAEGGFLLSEIQRENLGDEMSSMIIKITDAVCGSEENVDLSAITDSTYSQNMAIQMASLLHPLVEIAVLQEENAGSGVYRIDYGCTVDEHQALVKEFDEKVEAIVKACSQDAKTQEEYAKAVFEYLIQNTCYEYETYNDYMEKGVDVEERAKRYSVMSTVNVLVNGTGVCRQLSLAYSYLMHIYGIEAVELAGLSEAPFASNNSYYDGMTYGQLFHDNHMWNAICVDGSWYGVDVTFGTTTLENGGMTLQDAYEFWGMGEDADKRHFPSTPTVTTPGYTALENRSKTDLKDHKERTRASIGENFDDELKAVSCPDIPFVYEKGENDKEDRILVKGSGHEYSVRVMAPWNVGSIDGAEICYYLGSGENPDMENIEKGVIYIFSDAIEASVDPAEILNELCYCVVKGVEDAYQLSPKTRTLQASDEVANFALFAFYQSDGITKDIFNEYVVCNPKLQYNPGNVSLDTYENYFFGRCKEVPLSLNIKITNESSESDKARVSRMAEIIKKREYKQLKFELSTE